MPDLGGPRREPMMGFVVGTIVGAAVLGLAWLLLSGIHSGNAAGPPEPTTGSSGGSTDPASAHQREIARVQSCAAVWTAQAAPLRAADAALGQWEVHIGAMNKLVTGAITLHQANEFWSTTRVGAKAKLRGFAQAQRAYDRRTHGCPQRWAASGSPDLQKCRTAVSARNRTLRLAAVALKTWKGHVMAMDMLREGRMSGQQAEAMWLRMWTRGNHQVHAYTRAARDSQRLTC